MDFSNRELILEFERRFSHKEKKYLVGIEGEEEGKSINRLMITASSLEEAELKYVREVDSNQEVYKPDYKPNGEYLGNKIMVKLMHNHEFDGFKLKPFGECPVCDSHHILKENKE